MLVRTRLFLLIILMATAVLVACSPAGGGGAEPAAEEPTADHEHEEGEDADHDHSSGRIPNDGAGVRILSPADGAVFGTADEVLVEVETENFDLTAEGNHWHVYVDGTSFGMIVGGDTDQALRNLSPGEHEISVYLSNEAHEELEQGDAIMITVE